MIQLQYDIIQQIYIITVDNTMSHSYKYESDVRMYDAVTLLTPLENVPSTDKIN